MLRNILVALLMLTTCATLDAYAANKPAPAKKPPPPDYFPLRVNDWWKYQSTTAEGKNSNFMVKVISAEKQPDDTFIYLVDTNSTKVIHDWYSKPKGLVLRHKEQFGDDPNMLATYDPVYQFLKNPLTKDDTWQWKGKGMMGVDIEDSATVSGPETIITPAGKFSTMKVVTSVVQGGSPVTKTYWFADWVGLVKSATQSGPVGTVTELLDYSFKKPPSKK